MLLDGWSDDHRLCIGIAKMLCALAMQVPGYHFDARARRYRVTDSATPSSICVARHGGYVHQLTRLNTRAALSPVPQLLDRYPDGLDWLDRRIEDCAYGKASIFGVTDGNDLAAIAIETPKGRHLRKLSTFGVAPCWRLSGLGRSLMTALRLRWLREDVDQVHVTVDRTDNATKHFFRRHGFVELPRTFAAYGGDRLDCVYLWSAAADAIAYSPTD